MSLVVKIRLPKSRELELEVEESTTIKELIASLCSIEKCDEKEIELSRDGTPLSRDVTIADLGPAFLANPVLSSLILPKMSCLTSVTSFRMSLGSLEKLETLDSEERGVTIRFPVGTWVETKIKHSILVDSDNEWCLGKILEHTDTGYMISVFENHKFMMPPQIKAPYEDVRLGRSRSVSLARQKTGDIEYKCDTQLDRRKKHIDVTLEEKKIDESHGLKQPGKLPHGLIAPSFKKKRNSWAPGSSKKRLISSKPKSRSRRSLLDVSKDYRSNVRKYTAKYPKLRPSDVKMYVRLFRSELDKRKAGVIKKSEFESWIKANNFHLEESSIDELLRSLDTKGEIISMDNFIEIMSTQSARTMQNETRELFKNFDLDGDGVISRRELKSGMKNIFAQDIPEDKLTKMIMDADSTGRGSICFEDFCKMMKR